MHLFQIRYRNSQGTLMRILTAVSRRALDLPYVQAEPVENVHQVTLMLDATPKQVGQLCRDWRALVDVLEVRPATPLKEVWERGDWNIAAAPLPPASAVAPGTGSRPALA
jgi:acetolactate synthase small subunit